MTRVIEIRTGARLHFGLFAAKAERGRLGGIGMMIDRPGFIVRGSVRSGEGDLVTGPVEATNRVLEFLDRLRQSCPPERQDIRFRIDVLRTIPGHRGFGSGTQLALAVMVVTSVADSRWLPKDLFLGRGRRSLVGVLGYSNGGFIVDAGPVADALITDRTFQIDLESIPVVFERPRDRICRDVPDVWRTVVIEPTHGQEISGAAEKDAFTGLDQYSTQTTERLVQLTRDAVLPGLGNQDFIAFASGVAEFNRLVGEHFAPVQGGVYAHPLIRELSRILAETDWPYLAQSSWGPSAVVFCESEESAEALRLFLNRRISPEEADVFIAAPKNDGATVECSDQ